VNRLVACEGFALRKIRVEAGWAEMPTTPGLGIDIDAEAQRRHPYREFPPKGLRQYWDELPRRHNAVPETQPGAGGVVKTDKPE
jgi:galactonate dehydratase